MGQIRRTSHVITFGTSESKEKQSEISFKWEAYRFSDYLPEIFNAVSVRSRAQLPETESLLVG